MKILSPPLSLCLTTVAGILTMTTQVQAGSITLNATNSGNYNFNGTTTYTQASTTAYTTGRISNPQENRSYFVFTIPANISQANRTILGATLTLANPTNGSGAGLTTTGRTLNITNVTSSINNLINNGGGTNPGRQAVFNDLGSVSATNYGSTIVRSTTGTSVPITLNQNAILTDIRNAAGGQFAVGAAITGLTTAANQTIFVNSVQGTNGVNRQLTINFADALLGTNGNQQFGAVLIGQSANQTLTVTNIGETGSTLTGSIAASNTSTIQPTAGTVNFSLAANASSSRTFTYTPTVRGNNSANVAVTSNNVNTSLLLTGFGVAPVNAITNSTPDAGFVRIGTSGTVGVTLQNVGDGNLSGQGTISNLNGTSSLTGSSVHFIPTTGSVGNLSLTDNVSQTLNFAYTPTTHGAESQVLTLAFTNGSTDGTNQAQTRTVNLAGYGVGAVYQSSPVPGSTLDFGNVYINNSAFLPLTITNATQDPTNTLNLTGLTLLNAFFEGPDAEFFSLLNFTPGTQIAKGNSLPLNVKFTSTKLNGPKNATLRILTDQGVAFGQAGQTFSYNLTATTIPEPSSVLAMAILGTTGLFFKRKPN